MSCATECDWCGKPLPEQDFDRWLVARDVAGMERATCAGCMRRYRLVVTRIEKP